VLQRCWMQKVQASVCEVAFRVAFWPEGPVGRAIPAAGMNPPVPIRPAVCLCLHSEHTLRADVFGGSAQVLQVEITRLSKIPMSSGEYTHFASHSCSPSRLGYRCSLERRE
jgi:hypothetical protein